MIEGSCLCGAVRLQISAALGPATHCHCSMCRKAHGAAFGTYVLVKRSALAFVAGEDHVTTYRSTEGVTRSFCRTCGATLSYARDGRDSIAIALGVIDGDVGTRPAAHIFVGSKAPWFDITDALPQHETIPSRR